MIARIVIFTSFGLVMALDRPVRPPQPPSLTYEIIDLGTLPGCDATSVTGINDSGWVVGYAYKHVPPGHLNNMLAHPFVWRDGVMRKLDTLGGEYGHAYAINTSGDIAGDAMKAGYNHLPVIWRRANSFTPEALSSTTGIAYTLSDDGAAAGHIFRNNRYVAAEWRNDKRILYDSKAEVEHSIYSMSRSGVLAGYIKDRSLLPSDRFLLGERRAVSWINGKQKLLANPGDDESVAKGVNESGVIVGWCTIKLVRRACVWKNGSVSLLPPLASPMDRALAINRRGDIVGEARDTTGKERACLWEDGSPVALNKTIPPDSGWELHSANAINNNDWIIGIGHYDKFPNDRSRAFLLKPIPKENKRDAQWSSVK